jgi:K+-sensing histidine kinase KdpD
MWMIVVVVMIVVMVMIVLMWMVMIVGVTFTVAVSMSEMVVMCVTFTMAVSMGSMTEQLPDQKDDACENKHHTHDMTLLSVNLFLKLKADQGNDASQDERGNHMSERSQESHAHNARDIPTLCSCNDRQRNPVIGQNGMQDGNHGGSP